MAPAELPGFGDGAILAELITSEIGPVVGTHAGPGAVGIAFFQPEGEEEARLLAPLER